jgi:Spy/CpxP family protein refolding chaperone
MSSRITQVLLGLSLLLNCFVLAGFVYRSWVAPPSRHLVRSGQPTRGGPLEMLSEDLKLDEKQRQSLHDLFEKYAKERRDRFSEIQRIREEMVGELKKPAFDLSKIDSLVDEMSKVRAEQQKQNLSSISQLAPELKPDQVERLHEILAERFGGNQGGPNRAPGERRAPPR